MGPIQLMLCLLSAGIVRSSVLQLRTFLPLSEDHRTDASNKCRENGMKLFTVYNKDDARFVVNFGESDNGVWVGLSKKKTSTNETDPPKCPSTAHGVVTALNCSKESPFKCNRSSNEMGVTLNWCAARQYCQYHFSEDLASNVSESNESLWISGEITDYWEWDDGGCSTYREWKLEEYSDKGFASVTAEYKLKPHSNLDSLPAVCSKGDLRIVVVSKPRKTWEQALDYCDRYHSGLLQILTPEHQDAVELWLQKTKYNGTFWVGLRQSRVFGFWIWKDTMVNSSNWENGNQPVMPLSHQCGVITAPGYTWRDHNCLDPLPFICQEMIVRLKQD